MNNSGLCYISKASWKSCGNEYRIYDDRIELEFRMLFRVIIIPFEQLISINVFEPPVCKTRFWALKLDFADINLHVGIERKNGIFKHLRFTPDNVEEFADNVRKSQALIPSE